MVNGGIGRRKRLGLDNIGGLGGSFNGYGTRLDVAARKVGGLGILEASSRAGGVTYYHEGSLDYTPRNPIHRSRQRPSAKETKMGSCNLEYVVDKIVSMTCCSKP